MGSAKKLTRIGTIIVDCDGVLTDGKLYPSHTGEKMFKAFHSRDVRALRELVAHGYRVIIVTADDSDITKSFAEKCGCEIICERDKSLLPFHEIGDFICVVDDVWDVPLVQKARHAFCPADADEIIRQSGRKMTELKTCGGAGVIAELVRSNKL